MEQEQLHNMRHSCAHLLAAAVQSLWPDVKFGVGPVIDNGFYYDFDLEHRLTEEDLPKIEEKMRELAAQDLGFEREDLSIEDARKLFLSVEQPYKIELINQIEQTGSTSISEEPEALNKIETDNIGSVSVYKTGHFFDLCRGGHVESTKDIGPFKLLSVAGAYWRGKSENPMLQRIYGTCWATQEELDHYIEQLEEAKKRDHRKLGQQLELYTIDDMVGKGLVLWLPKGTIIRDAIEQLARNKEAEGGYERVITPHMAKEELFLTSGHLPYYKDGMYPPMVMDDGTYYLKAMNCPMHHRIYQSRPRSYRELPMRLAEYGTVYRNELSGTLAGLLRVRGMAMNDAHIYCRKDQIKSEFSAVIKLVTEYFDIFGLTDYWFRLSEWDPKHTEKYFDEPESWEFAQNTIREVLQDLNVPFTEVDDEAAFYGPKVDIQFRSVIGREETMSTVQLDFSAKQRFGLSYIDEEGGENNEVFVIHRAPLSTHERFLAFLIEHYAGKFPLWLAPTQLVVIPISEKVLDYAHKITNELKSNGFRVEQAAADVTLGKNIRTYQELKVPYMLIVGGKEAETNTVSVRGRDDGDLGTQELSELLNQLKSGLK